MLDCFNHTARSVPALEPLLETGNAKKRGDGLALAPAVRSRYHQTSPESGWNIRKRQVNWIMLQRTQGHCHVNFGVTAQVRHGKKGVDAGIVA
jgi:hypothetical protein